MKQYRADMPPMPPTIKKLPVQNGYPVPWFVLKPEVGEYDFRVTDLDKMKLAIAENLCWVCGQRIGPKFPKDKKRRTLRGMQEPFAFAIGPMCAVNRVTAEPPAHPACAEWSAKACPFLTQKQIVRRMTNLPEGEGYVEAAGIPLDHQPGAICIWHTRSYRQFDAPNGILFHLGDAVKVTWWRKARPATRAEVMESINSGIPHLQELAELDGPIAVAMLAQMKAIALELIPEE